MQLQTFEIKGLFHKYNHRIAFPTTDENDDTASLVILHGPNGIGKTTLLAMLNGLMELDFDPFRAVPFKSARLTFNDGTSISVAPRTTKQKDQEKQFLKVTFAKESVELHTRDKGAFDKNLQEEVNAFRERFYEHTRTVTVDFISIDRLRKASREPHQPPYFFPGMETERPISRDDVPPPYINAPRMFRPEPVDEESMSKRMQRFMREAQLEHRRFFSIGQPDLFAKIIDRVTHPRGEEFRADELLDRLERIRNSDTFAEKYHLARERWDYPQLKEVLASAKRSKSKQHVLPIIGSYVEVLESRAEERDVLANRLKTFEEVVNDFLLDKTVHVDARTGVTVVTKGTSETKLNELQLSSGEYHLLYLLVAATTTRRRGTVIAIDEPEMSMHIEWQRKLLPAMLKCASMAQPQLVVATHSPEIAADYPDQCLKLGG